MLEHGKVDWSDVFSSFVVGVVSTIGALFAWFNRRFSSVHKRIDEVETKASLYAVHIGVQQAQHLANQQRLDGIEDGLRDIDVKQDKQMNILLEMNTRRRG